MSTSRKRPTIKDVAAAAGVGVMTVSYSFNQPTRVADETRRRVLDAAERLGYRRPDSTARALRSGRTGQLGVVVGEHLSYVFDDPQAALFLAGVADVCVDQGLGMVLIPTHGDDADVDRVLDAAVDSYVLWTTTDDDPVLHAVASSGRPAAIQGGPDLEGLACVSQDDRAAAAAVAAAALGRGGTPVVISFPLDRDREAFVGPVGDLPRTVPFPVTRHRLPVAQGAPPAVGSVVVPACRADDDSAPGGPDAERSICPVVATVGAAGYRRAPDEELAAATEGVLVARRAARGGDAG